MSSWSLILVNDISSQEFKFQLDFRQGNPLAPFLFLVVKKGLSDLMQVALENNYFMVIQWGTRVVLLAYYNMPMIQFVFGEANVTNVFIIKNILRMFELVSWLKVNFYKGHFGALGVSYGVRCGCLNMRVGMGS